MITVAQAKALEKGDLVRHDDSTDIFLVTKVAKEGVDVKVRREDGGESRITGFTEADLGKISIVSSIGAGEASTVEETADNVELMALKPVALLEHPDDESDAVGTLPAGFRVRVVVRTKDESYLMVLYNGALAWVDNVEDAVEVTGNLDLTPELPVKKAPAAPKPAAPAAKKVDTEK